MTGAFLRASTLLLGCAMAFAVLLFHQMFLTCFPPPKLAALAVFTSTAIALAAGFPGLLASVPPFAPPLVAVAAWAALGEARAISPDSFALSFLLPGAAAAAAWLAHSLSRHASERIRLIAALVFSHLICGLYAVAQYYRLDPFTWTLDYGRGRVFSTMGNPNFLAGEMVLVLPILAALGAGGGGQLRWLARAAFLACLPAFALAQTRGAWVGLVLGTAAAAAAWLPSRRSFTGTGRKLAWAGVAAALCFLFFSLPSLNPTGLSLPSQLSSSFNVEQQSARQRLFWWRSAFALFSSSPVAGVGLGNFARDFPSFSRRFVGAWSDLPPAFADHPHNDFLFVLCENGIIGLGLLLWLTACWSRILLRRAREGSLLHLATIAGLAGLAIHAVWNMPSLQQGTLMTAGILLGITCAGKKEGRSPAEEGTGRDGPPVRLAALTLGAGLAIALAVSFRPAVLLLAQDYYNGGRIMKEDKEQASPGVAAFLLRNTLKLTDAPWRINFMLGSVLYAQHYYGEALKAFEEDERENPFGADAVLHQAKCLREMGRLAEAERLCRRALLLVPNYAEAALTIATMDYRTADEARRSGNRVEMRERLGRTRVWLNYALRCSPRHAEALILLGHIEIMEGRWKKALAAWEKALALRPANDSLRNKVETLRVDLPRLLRGGQPR